MFNSMWAFEYVGIFSNAHKIIYIYLFIYKMLWAFEKMPTQFYIYISLFTKCCGHLSRWLICILKVIGMPPRLNAHKID